MILESVRILPLGLTERCVLSAMIELKTINVAHICSYLNIGKTSVYNALKVIDACQTARDLLHSENFPIPDSVFRIPESATLLPLSNGSPDPSFTLPIIPLLAPPKDPKPKKRKATAAEKKAEWKAWADKVKEQYPLPEYFYKFYTGWYALRPSYETYVGFMIFLADQKKTDQWKNPEFIPHPSTLVCDFKGVRDQYEDRAKEKYADKIQQYYESKQQESAA